MANHGGSIGHGRTCIGECYVEVNGEEKLGTKRSLEGVEGEETETIDGRRRRCGKKEQGGEGVWYVPAAKRK